MLEIVVGQIRSQAYSIMLETEIERSNIFQEYSIAIIIVDSKYVVD